MAKRILIYTNHFYPEQFKINDVVDWLGSSNNQIRVVTCIPNYPSGKFYKDYGIFNSIYKNNNIIINRLPLIPRGNGSSFLLLLNYLSYFFSCVLFTLYLGIFVKKYDIVLVHHTSPFLIALNPLVYRIFNKSKCFLWDLDIWPETLEAVNVIKSKYIINLFRKIIIFTYSFYDKILISSNGLKYLIRERFSNDIEYFPNWADKEIEEISEEYKIELNIPKDRFVIMYTGNIGQSQNFDLLVETIKYFNPTNNVFWIFIGDGRFKNTFIKKLAAKGLQKNCLFTGYVDNKKIHSYSKYADAMYLSLNDNIIFNNTLPAKLQTYLALSKPIIGVLKGEGEKIILESNSGIVESNNDYLSLSLKIENLLKLSKKELIQLGINGRNYYDKNFSSKKRKKQIINLINK